MATRGRGGINAAALCAALCAAACGASSPPPAPSHTPTPTATPPATTVPDQESVTLLATGVGTFDLVAIPVALLRNDAARHGAASVAVHFATSRNGTALGQLDAALVNLAPGETLAVTADCTDACQGATEVTATINVGSWVAVPGPAFTAGPAAYACPGCGGGHGHGDVTGAISTAHLSSGAPVVVFAACSAGDGRFIGGGSRQLIWPGASPVNVDVAVIVSEPPASCQLGASTGW